MTEEEQLEFERVNSTLRDGEVRKRVFFVRHTTTTREAIYLTVSQRYNDKGKLSLPTITVSGNPATYVESYQFAIDYGETWLRAGLEARDWSRYVDSALR